MSAIFSIFSKEDLEYLTQHPAVHAAKEKLVGGKVYFTLPITDSIRATLLDRLGLRVGAEIPMRWIKGDTAPHFDAGASPFEHTYLVYLQDSPGELMLDSTPCPITQNTAYIFQEGVRHWTQNTGTTSRLLLGPMSEHIEPVGATITYYNNYADAVATNGNYIANQGVTWILGDQANIYGSIAPYTSWRIAAVPGYGGSIPSGAYSNGFDLTTLGLTGYGVYVYPSTPCFLEGTPILCLMDGM